MSWHGIRGHDDVVNQFRLALERGRLASSFLFVGPPGIGKRSFALKLAQAFLCRTRADEALDPCGTCPGCVQVLAKSHPDLEIVAKPKDKSFLPLELLIGDKEHRMRRGLCHALALKPFEGGRKIALIDDADFLNAEGANSLLKTLEEPPPKSLLILIGTSAAKQLPTIRSRCQLVRFRPLDNDVIAELLLSEHLVEDAAEARRVASFSEGSLQTASELTDADLWAFRSRLLAHLANPEIQSVRLSSMVLAFVNEAGKEAPPRRRRLRQVIGLATDFYRRLLRTSEGAGSCEDDELLQCLDRALNHGANGQRAAACLQRCLAAAEQVDRQANQATLVECWLDDLARILAGGANPVR